MFYQLAIVIALFAQQFTACPYVKTGNLVDKELAHAGEDFHRRLSSSVTPAQCLTRGSTLVPSKVGICSVYNGLKSDFYNNIVPTLTTPLLQGNLIGAALRLAFHDAAEVDLTNESDTMGPDGCLSSDTASNGLNSDASLVNTVIEPLWQNYCDYISRADFWVLFAIIAVQYAETTNYLQLPFQYGRVDAAGSCDAGSGRLPDSTRGMPAIIDTFVTQMQLTLNDAAALIGGHSVGHVHEANSGFTMAGDNTADDGLVNGWDTTPHIFDNLFYRQLLTFNWHNMLNPAGDKAEWKRNPLHQYAIMLNTDMALAYDLDVTGGVGITGQVCGPFGTETSSFGCYPSSTMMPATCNAACRFANDMNVWLDHFRTSFTLMTTRGYGDVYDYSDGATSTGKLGTVTSIDLSTC